MNGKGEWFKFFGVLALSGLVSYFTAIGTLQTRVSVLEVQYGRLMDDLSEIKADVKLLLRREP